MSTRSNGMIDTARQHKSFAALETALMLPSDPAAPNAASVNGPQPVERDVPEASTPIASAVRRKPKAETTDLLSDILDNAPTRPNTEVLHTRIPDFVDTALKDKIEVLKKANPAISKQAIVTLALIKVLGVTPPEGFRLY